MRKVLLSLQRFASGVRDAANIRLLIQMQRSHPKYRAIVHETQKVQAMIFLCQIIYSLFIQKLLDWCWAPLRGIWILSLNTYINIVFEVVLFLFVGWKTIDLNHKFSKLFAYNSVAASKSKQQQQQRYGTETIYDNIGRMWEKMILHLNDALFELVKMLLFSILSRGLLSSFYWTFPHSGMWKVLSFSSLSIIQSIQIFDQAFSAVPRAILSRIYDQHLSYFVGFGTWISLMFLFLPIPIHFQFILLYWAYPWLLILALNASIQPTLHIGPEQDIVGVEKLLLRMHHAFNRMTQWCHDYKLFSILSTIVGWNAYYWKPILYVCGLCTFASGCVRLGLFIALTLVPPFTPQNTR